MLLVILCGAATAQGDCPSEVRVEPSDSLDSLIARVWELRAEGCNRSVHHLTNVLVPRAEAEYGPRSGQLAEILELHVEAQYSFGDRDAIAIAKARRALAIRLDTPGEAAEVRARSHRILGSLLSDQLHDTAQVAEALEHFERARALWAEAAGPRSPWVADVLAWIAELIDDWGAEGRERALDLPWIEDLVASDSAARREVAERVAELNARLPDPSRGRLAASSLARDPALAVALRGVVLARESGTESEEYAHTLNILGNMLNRRQLYDEAQVVFEECLGVRIRVSGPRHPQTVRAHHNHGEALMLIGELERARPDLEIAYQARRAWGVAGTTTQVLGKLLSLTGDLQAAVTFYRDAVPMLRKDYGEVHWRHAEALTQLAECYELLGEAREAERRYRTALEALAGSVSPDGPRTALARARLGRLLAAGGDREEGRRLLLEARAAQEAAPEARLEDYAITLGGLAEIAAAEGDLETALTLRREASDALARYQGLHPALADALLAVAEAELAVGLTASAEVTLERAAALLPALGEEAYALRARRHDLLGRVLRAQGRFGPALEHATLALDLSARHLAPAARLLPPEAALRFARNGRNSLDLVAGLLADHPHPPRAVTAAWEAIAAHRGLVGEELQRRQRLARGESDPAIRVLLEELQAAQRNLAYVQLHAGRAATPAERAVANRHAAVKVQARERALAEALAARHLGDRGSGARLSEVLDRLPPKSALISYLRYGGGGDSSPARYGAFVAASGSTARFVDLGPAAAVDRAVDRWHAAMLPDDGDWAAAENALRAGGRTLHRLVWAPVASSVGTADLAFLVPDGALFFVSFAALPRPAGSGYLIEDGPRFHHLVRESDLVRSSGRAARSGPPTLFAIGGPDFYAGRPQLPAAAATPSLLDRVWATAGETFLALFRDPCRGGDRLHFPPLPEAGREVAEISALFAARSTRLVAAEATEEAFTRLAPEHSVLHVATHSFFDLRCPRRGGTRGVADLLLDPPDGRRPVPGLALAGANLPPSSAEDGKDGILTVSEIAALDLSRVDWVVLSACETALGQVASGEGVLGLARGFQVAGARSLVLSLWPVEDRATRDWMAALYRARFGRGETTAQAIHSAGLEILEGRRRAGETTHPLFWAGFVGVGSWD